MLYISIITTAGKSVSLLLVSVYSEHRIFNVVAVSARTCDVRLRQEYLHGHQSTVFTINLPLSSGPTCTDNLSLRRSKSQHLRLPWAPLTTQLCGANIVACHNKKK